MDGIALATVDGLREEAKGADGDDLGVDLLQAARVNDRSLLSL